MLFCIILICIGYAISVAVSKKAYKDDMEVDRKIIFKTIRRKHLRTDTVKVQNSKEELEYYIHDKLWIYTNKKVILKFNA